MYIFIRKSSFQDNFIKTIVHLKVYVFLNLITWRSPTNPADLVVSSSQTHSPGWRLSIRDYKRPPPKGSGEMPIPFLSEKSPTLASDNWCLILTQDFTKGDDYTVFIILWLRSTDFTKAKLTSNRHLLCSY